MDGLFEAEGFRVTDDMALGPIWEPGLLLNASGLARPDRPALDLEGWHLPADAGDIVVLLDDNFLLPGSGKSTGTDGGLGPMFTDGEADLGEIVVTGERPDDTGGYTGSGGRGGEPPADHPSLEDNPGDIEPLTRILCDLADLVEDLDGNFFSERDGDGIDEFINILTVASIALGFGGLEGLAGRVAVNGVNSGAFLNAIASVFGDDIALRISYIAFGEIGAGGIVAGTFTAAFKDILQVLTNGNPPQHC